MNKLEIGIAAIIAVVVVSGLLLLIEDKTSSVEEIERSGPYDIKKEAYRTSLTMFRDPRTGCQYLGRHKWGLVPRMNKKGEQICE